MGSDKVAGVNKNQTSEYFAPVDSLLRNADDATVAEIMDRDPYVCHVDDTVGQVADRLIALKVSSLPVVEGSGEKDSTIVGFISDGDIMRAIASYEPQAIFTGGQSSMVYFDDEPLPQKVQKLSGQNIMDIATSKVVCVRSDQSVGRVARILAKKQFKKMPVVDGDGALVGVIRRKSIIKFAFLNIFHNGSDAPRSDR